MIGKVASFRIRTQLTCASPPTLAAGFSLILTCIERAEAHLLPVIEQLHEMSDAVFELARVPMHVVPVIHGNEKGLDVGQDADELIFLLIAQGVYL